MKGIVVFSGPTLAAEEVRRELDAEVLPPAARGDILRAVLAEPAAIGLIDGYFDRVPSVWHKEILWALSQGIHVFGAASMGALRAAELADFGMVGIGEVFEHFRQGTLEDDDEVAVVHSARDDGYRPLSEAMVNIRATLAAAEGAAIVSASTRAALVAVAKVLPYPDRSYPMILRVGAEAEVPSDELARLRQWLPTGAVNQKRDDARAMLREMSLRARAGWTRKEVSFTFSATDAWRALQDDISKAQAPGGSGGASCAPSALLEELILAGEAARARDGALSRALCVERLERLGVQLEAPAVTVAVERFRRERELLSAEGFAAWLSSTHLDDAQIDGFFHREAAVRAARQGFERQMLGHLADYLRATGEYASLAARVEAKRRLLAKQGVDSSPVEATGMSEQDLFRWYFVQQLGEQTPTDMHAFASAQGCGVDQLRLAVAREYLYVTLDGGAPKATPCWESEDRDRPQAAEANGPHQRTNGCTYGS